MAGVRNIYDAPHPQVVGAYFGLFRSAVGTTRRPEPYLGISIGGHSA